MRWPARTEPVPPDAPGRGPAPVSLRGGASRSRAGCDVAPPARRARARVGARAGVFLAVLAAALLPAASTPGPRVVWVRLTPEAARSELPPALSAEALALRERSGVGILDTDRPIRPEVIAAIEGTGARVRVVSRWLRAVSVEATPAAVDRLRRLPGVAGIDAVAVLETAGERAAPAPAPVRLPSLAAAGPVTRAASAAPARFEDYGLSEAVMRQLGVDAAHRLGFTGRGVRIAVLDAGFDLTHESVAGLAIVATRDFIHGDAIVSDRPGEPPGGAAHGTRTLSIIAGNAPGSLVGPAPEAEFVLAKVDRRQNRKSVVDEDRWVAALQWADSLGARIVHTSLTYRAFVDRSDYTFPMMDGATAPSSRAVAEAALRGIVVVTPMGDVTPAVAGSLMAPADAPGALSVGASTPAGVVAPFSARGPTADGRIKPDLVAPGTQVAGASAGSPASYATSAGTDRAAALITGAAALVLEAWPSFTVGDVRAALTGSATLALSPNTAVGHGIPNVAMAIAYPDGIRTAPVEGADGTGTLLTLSPRFLWEVPRTHPAIGGVRYRVEVATDQAFRDVVAAESASEAGEVMLRSPIRPAPTLWWRVVAESDAGITRATPALGPLFMPRWVRLTALSSASDQYTTATRPRLTWSAIQASPPVGPLTFDVQILDANTGAVLQSMDGIPDTTITVLDPLAYNTPYRWRVIARSPLGVADTVESAAPFVVTSASQPPATVLYQNFPNPFPMDGRGDPGTRIWFDLDRPTPVRLAVYDLRGRLVRRLIPARSGCGDEIYMTPGLYGRNGETSPTGCILTYWDGTDDLGRRVPRGVYILRLTTSVGDQTRPMVYLGDP